MADTGTSITRVYEASREQVFTMWTDPEHYAAWLTPPPFVTPATNVRMIVEPGGMWAVTMINEAEGPRTFHGTYLEVVEPEKLVFTLRRINEESDETVTVTFSDLGGGKTEMVFQQDGSLAPELYEVSKEKWSYLFDRLAEQLGKL